MQNPIICFEGPSGIGKSTLCNLLSKEYSIVPEVNLLFEKPSDAHPYWYLEKQIERFNRGAASGQPVIMDGDTFQPIWYNWVCRYPSKFLSKKESHEFYQSAISEGKIQYPDLYIVFQADIDELRRRKAADATRQRRNFEKHLKIIEPCKKYWQFLDEETSLSVKFVNYGSIENTEKKVRTILEAFRRKRINDLEVFHQIDDWLKIDLKEGNY